MCWAFSLSQKNKNKNKKLSSLFDYEQTVRYVKVYEIVFENIGLSCALHRLIEGKVFN